MAKKVRIGIQGGKGSFNEEACLFYAQEHKLKNYEIVYLYTADRVMKALNAGTIDRGICAIHNSVGGIVWETANALGTFGATITDKFAIIINHCLLVKPGKKVSDLTVIMSHPQALAQTAATRAKKYPGMKFESGKGILVDQATAAKSLGEGKLPDTVGVIASKVCADLYDLTILAKGLQDSKNNLTTFIFAKKNTGRYSPK